jgi:beta-lactamase class A
MTTAPTLASLDAYLTVLPGTISVWCGPAGATTPAYARLADEAHYAASTMKAAVLAALYRAAEAGTLDLDAPVPVANDFASAKPRAPRFTNDQGYDQDDDVWALLGGVSTLRWLARRMIVRSSNFATNLVLAHVGVPAVAEVLRIVGVTRMRVERGIEDADAREAGIDNIVTARDLALLLGVIAVDAAGGDAGDRERLAAPATCEAMLEVLFAQEHMEDLGAGLPPGTRIAHKNGWITGVRHGAGIVFPDDAPPYAIVVCTTTPLADTEDGDDACTLIAQLAAASWADRHAIGAT